MSGLPEHITVGTRFHCSRCGATITLPSEEWQLKSAFDNFFRGFVHAHENCREKRQSETGKKQPR